MSEDQAYHSRRAQMERDLAAHATDQRAAEAHLRLSALHLSQAMVLEEVDQKLGATVRRDGLPH